MFKKRTLDGKINFVVRILFVIAFAETIIFAVLTKDSSNIINAFTALLGFALTFVPEAVENISKKRIRFSSGVKIAIVLFIFAAELLGEINSFYEKIPWWDNMLHSLSGAILALIGFMLVYAMNESKKVEIHLSPLFIAAFAFFFAVAAGAVWEIFEFAGDRLFSMNMQKFRPPDGVSTLTTETWRYDAGLIDTMTDIILDTVTAFAVAVSGYIKIKTGKWKAENYKKKEDRSK
ncbi:MAG: hypothetical protein Q4G23_00020 [Clostridia bacterium]|nr:hypothetical protein [Clostridia bacterium]